MQQERAQKIRVVVRELMLDGMFVGGLGLSSWGVWRWVPEVAPVIIGAVLVVLSGAMHFLASRSS